MQTIDFQTDPSRYRHWRIERDGDVAYLIMDVDQAGGLGEGYELKLNSYDLGVDIELNDAVQRLRFEHPEVRCVVIKSGKDNVFCAGANIRMLGKATHGHKVNFCKFTNETRLAIEDATDNSKQIYICAINGNAAGGGYELALAADHIMLVDDRRSAVALPETPLLAVLPGTGGLTRVTDKRKVRRDRADVFCSIEEGIRGTKAVEWRLVDEVVPNSKWKETVAARAKEIAARSDRPKDAKGITLTPLERKIEGDRVSYSHVDVEIDRPRGLVDRHRARAVANCAGIGRSRACARRQILAADRGARTGRRHPASARQRGGHRRRAVAHRRQRAGRARSRRVSRQSQWRLADARNPPLPQARAQARRCDAEQLHRADRAGLLLCRHAGRTGLRRRPLADADRHPRGRQPQAAAITLGHANFGLYPMGNGLTRLQTRFLGEPDTIKTRAKGKIGIAIEGEEAAELGLVTAAYEDFDWDDELRVMLEERTSFSPDAMTGMEANLRFAGPETMETKIFGRLTAWQNWIFQRPNAIGEQGALKLYGSGVSPTFNKERV